MSVSLPPNPSIDQLKRQARELLAEFEAGSEKALSRVQTHRRRFRDGPDRTKPLTLQEAQWVVAREYGFRTWTELKRRVQDPDQAAITSLIEAANDGHAARVAEILKEQPSLVNIRGGHGTRTALHFAAWREHLEVVRLLLDHGANPSPRCVEDNATPLHLAVQEGHVEVVNLLLEREADPIGEGDLHDLAVIGWASVYHATLHQGEFSEVREKIVSTLLTHGAEHHLLSALFMKEWDLVRSLAARDPSAVNRPMSRFEAFRTPLHRASTPPLPISAVHLLIELGADLEARSSEGFTPLDEAAVNNEWERAQILLDAGAPVEPPAAFLLNREDDIRRCMSEDPDCLKVGGQWESLIVFASERSSGETVKRLIDYGASVNARATSRGTKRYTPLHGAAFDGNMEAAQVLIQHGASLTVTDETYNSTPMEWAKVAEQETLAELLSAHAANE